MNFPIRSCALDECIIRGKNLLDGMKSTLLGILETIR